MDSLILEAPINSLSFGNVSVNLLKELYKLRDSTSVSLFPIGNKIELSAFDSLDPDIEKWIHECFNSRLLNLNTESKTIKLWHLNGSEMRVGKTQLLYTFYEASRPTKEELSIHSMQDKVVFSSTYSKNKFDEAGASGSHYVPIGFDSSFFIKNKTYLENQIHFGLMGKWEERKNTAQIIRSWAKKYGNNYKYQLTCCVTNPFISPKKLSQLIKDTLEGKNYGNINFLPFLKTNSEVNDYLNSIDIDLTGLSGAEGWNLPAFNATALGKWSIVLNHTSHKDWATEKNCILVEPEGTCDIEDGVFFQKDSSFNQGLKYTVSDETIINKMEIAESFRHNNEEGKKLQEVYTYTKTLEQLLSII